MQLDVIQLLGALCEDMKYYANARILRIAAKCYAIVYSLMQYAVKHIFQFTVTISFVEHL